jgi:hypothetical protein
MKSHITMFANVCSFPNVDWTDVDEVLILLEWTLGEDGGSMKC